MKVAFEWCQHKMLDAQRRSHRLVANSEARGLDDGTPTLGDTVTASWRIPHCSPDRKLPLQGAHTVNDHDIDELERRCARDVRARSLVP
jgi:hypothetical protein